MTLEQFIKHDWPSIQQKLKQSAELTSPQPLNLHISPVDPLDLLPYTICEKIFFFSSKDQDFTILGLGEARSFSPQEVSSFFHQYPELFLSAHLTFENDPQFKPYVLHEWTFIKHKHTTTLTIFKNNESKYYSRPQLFFDFETPFDSDDIDFNPPWVSYEEMPEHDQWGKMIETANHLFETNELQKIVLSRQKIFGYSEPIDSKTFFLQLLAKNKTLKSFKLFHQIRFGETFISITPERLFSLKEKHFESISLAGSAPRGATPEEDREYENFLLNDDKLIREHSLVTEEINKKLMPLSEDLQILPLQTMKLPYIQHRQADIKAELKKDVTVLELIALLHPTPAVGGLPWEKAKIRLPEIEPFKRHYYAAPVGFVSSHFSELAVGIRSAKIDINTLTLYGGAGIVRGSEAESEWNETGTKMHPFLKVVNNE